MSTVEIEEAPVLNDEYKLALTTEQFHRMKVGAKKIPLDLARQPQSLGEIISRMGEIRDERRALSKRDSELVQEWEALDAKLVSLLDEQKMNRASTDELTATITETLLPSVEDWDAFLEYIKENDALYLLQRRVTTNAYRELHDSGESVPGVRPIVKRSISLRKR